MRKIILAVIILAAFVLNVHAQNVTVSNVSVSLSMLAPDASQDSLSMTISSQISTPVAGSKVVLLAGSDKDLQDVGTARGIFYQIQGAWVIEPVALQYSSGRMLLPLTIAKVNSSRLKYLTLYVTDINGNVISNKLYYKMP